LGIGDWGLGGVGPDPKPQTTNPKPKAQKIKKYFKKNYLKKIIK